jgi:hypothetical protein
MEGGAESCLPGERLEYFAVTVTIASSGMRGRSYRLPYSDRDFSLAIIQDLCGPLERGVMREILPGLFHWSVYYDKIKIEVSSYYLSGAKVLLDPLLPMGGSSAFEPGVEHILLTNRHHYRDSAPLVEKYGCTVWCIESGMHEFSKGEDVKPFKPGDTLPGGIQAEAIGAICPDETALVLSQPAGVVALADGVIRRADGPLEFVPDKYMGDDPEGVKAGLRDSYRRLLSLHEFDHMLLAHGEPWIGGASRALREFLEKP